MYNLGNKKKQENKKKYLELHFRHLTSPWRYQHWHDHYFPWLTENDSRKVLDERINIDIFLEMIDLFSKIEIKMFALKN